MRQVCTFSPKCDRGKVIDNLFPDVNELIESHKIKDCSSEVVYNQLSDIKDVGFRVNDEFDAIMLARHLKAAGLTPNSGKGSSQQAGSSAPVSSPSPTSAPTSE